MPSVAIFDAQNRLKEFITSVDPSAWQARPDVLIFDDRSNPTEQQIKTLLNTVPIIYVKVNGLALEEMTVQEKSSVDAEIAAKVLADQRLGAMNILNSPESQSKAIRAFADIVKDEVNIVRQWMMSYKAEVAAATSLTNLQTRVAGLPNLSDRTLDQLKTAIINRISSGSVD